MFWKNCICISNIMPGFANGMPCHYKVTKDNLYEVRKKDEKKIRLFTAQQFGKMFKDL